MSARLSETGRVYVLGGLVALSAASVACSQGDTNRVWEEVLPDRHSSDRLDGSISSDRLDEAIKDIEDTDHLCAPDTQTEWQQIIPPTDETPDLGDARVRLYIPCGVKQASGVIIFSHIGVGEWEYDHEMWRAFAETDRYALVMIELGDIHGKVAPWGFPGQSARFVTRILSTMAEHSRHEEMTTSPLFFFGHSAGGFWFTRMIPEISGRTAGFLAFHGALPSEAFFEPDSLAVPGLFLVAEYDPIWIRRDSTEIVTRGRENGAKWAMVVEPDAGHWDVDPGRRMMIDFTKTVFQRRVGPAKESGATPLSELPANNGWLGQLEHKSVYNGDEEFEGSGKEIVVSAAITPWNDTDSNTGNWLISESFAQSWLSYELNGFY